MKVDLKKRKFTREAYYLMAEVGIFSSDERIELLNGEIINMSPVGSQHIGIINWLNHFLARSLQRKVIVSIQSPINLGVYSEPEPDITICHFQDHYYRNRKVQPKDVILLIEVSDTTLAKDREVKLPLYAEAGIQTYWIVNISERQVEVYSDPEENVYKKTIIYSEDDFVELPEFQFEFLVKEMLG